jgi:hypothetical protein
MNFVAWRTTESLINDGQVRNHSFLSVMCHCQNFSEVAVIITVFIVGPLQEDVLELQVETLCCSVFVLVRLHKTFYILLWTGTARAIWAVATTE